jgi:uncharacterized protein (TIGR03067 family)
MSRLARRGWLVLSALLAVAAAGWWALRGGPRTDHELLQGEWALVSAVFDGAPIDPDKARAMGLVIVDDVWTTKVGAFGQKQYRVTLSLEKAPREFDQTQIDANGRPLLLTVAKGEKSPIVEHGLYEVGRSSLRLALSRTANARPKSFEPAEDMLLYTYQRVQK